MFSLELNTSNAAFADDPAAEVIRILREVANRMERDDDTEGAVYDLNGNRVGRFVLNHGIEG